MHIHFIIKTFISGCMKSTRPNLSKSPWLVSKWRVGWVGNIFATSSSFLDNHGKEPVPLPCEIYNYLKVCVAKKCEFFNELNWPCNSAPDKPVSCKHKQDSSLQFWITNHICTNLYLVLCNKKDAFPSIIIINSSKIFISNSPNMFRKELCECILAT